jgi:hypothetical protein
MSWNGSEIMGVHGMGMSFIGHSWQVILMCWNGPEIMAALPRRNISIASWSFSLFPDNNVGIFKSTRILVEGFDKPKESWRVVYGIQDLAFRCNLQFMGAYNVLHAQMMCNMYLVLVRVAMAKYSMKCLRQHSEVTSTRSGQNYFRIQRDKETFSE